MVSVQYSVTLQPIILCLVSGSSGFGSVLRCVNRLISALLQLSMYQKVQHF